MIPTLANIRKALYILNKRIDELSEGITSSELINKINTLEQLISEGENPTQAIDKFNEIVSFLDSLPNTQNLVEILNSYALKSDIVQSDWNQKNSEAKDYIKNKPTIPSEVTEQTVSGWGFTKNTGNSNFSGNYNDLTNKPTIPNAQIQSDWNQDDSTAKDYIKNKPTIPTIPVIDNTPTQNSTNLITSGGVYSYIESKEIIDIRVISTNVNSECTITGVENSGKIQYILYVNNSNSDFIITIPTTYVTPNGNDIILTCPSSGYSEVSYINVNGVIYARGL